MSNRIASNLKFLREREKKSMGKLAKILGITKQKLANMEYGKSIDTDTLILFADFYDVALDDLIRNDLSKVKVIHKVETKPVIPSPEPAIPVPETIPDEEKNLAIGQALECAKKANFICYFYNEKKIQFDFCKECFNAEFWSKAALAQDLNDSKVEDVKVEGTDYLECTWFQMVPGPHCSMRTIQNINNPKCHECLRDIKRWGRLAIGFDKLKGDVE